MATPSRIEYSGEFALRDLLWYLPDTGDFFWRPRTPEMFPADKQCPELSAKGFNKVFAGKPAFRRRDSEGYLRGRLMGRDYFAHRVAWAFCYGVWPEGEIDHINHIRDDNRIVNLRDVSRRENCMNQRRFSARKGGGGVRWDAQRQLWRADIRRYGRRIFVGRFPTEKEAISAQEATISALGLEHTTGARPVPAQDQ